MSGAPQTRSDLLRASEPTVFVAETKKVPTLSKVIDSLREAVTGLPTIEKTVPAAACHHPLPPSAAPPSSVTRPFSGTYSES